MLDIGRTDYNSLPILLWKTLKQKRRKIWDCLGTKHHLKQQ